MKHIFELYKQNRYKIISERMIEVDSKIVTKQIKKGREVLTCSCENSGRFASNQMCRHKQFFVSLPILNYFNNKLDKLIEYYEVAKTMGTEEVKKINETIFLDLKDLKELK